jgi:hypothetical protein
MAELFENNFWAFCAALSALCAAIAIIADQRRAKRPVLENVGFMPWTGLSIFATLVTVLCIAVAIKSG